MLINLKKGDFHQILSEDSSTKPCPIKVNLSWNQKPRQNTGFLKKIITDEVPILDLICVYSTINGKEGAISLLDGVGAKDKEPYILLEEANCTDGSQNSKNLIIYQPEIIKTAMFMAIIPNGKKSFKHVNSQLVFEINNEEQICIKLKDCKRNYFVCQIAVIDNIDSKLKIVNLVKYLTRDDLLDLDNQ